jgi:septum formation protein
LGNLILSADTVVVLDGQILGKPKDRPENEQYLRRLMGKTHRVISGICLLDVDSGVRALGCEVSEVTFRELSPAEIITFIESGEGLDKAGGYGIQGLAGNFVSQLSGPKDNVVGLPMQLLERLLKENGWNVDRRKS